jgi:gliding motility-associated-like protein
MSKLHLLRILFLIIVFNVGCSLDGFSTHQRAAEITYRHLSGLTYEITLISYTFTPSPANAYRDYLTIVWGDGTASEIPRVAITILPDSITYNKYIGQHTFPGPSNYTISCEDPNRNGGILNIPNSINTPLFIYSELTISPFIGGYNNSPVLLIPPVDNGCVNQPFFHNPGAYDADGDSLSYRLVSCRGAQGQVIPGYTLPAASNSLTLDAVSGDLIWDSPKQQGEYNIAILIEEWRNGQKIGSILRDMQIIVVACNNRPPVIDSVADTCIEAGKNLRFVVKSYDPDSNMITLTGTGGPLILSVSPATLEPNPATGLGHTQALFRWNTICNHVKKSPFQVFFKAKDNASPVNLVTIKSMKILVVGPAPVNLTATPKGNTIKLTWDIYSCTNATGFRIFRKSDSTGYVPGYCQTGVPGYLGYSLIGEVDTLGQTEFLDDNNGAGLSRGLKYCYLVIAVYPDKAESYASNEACATLKKDIAVITNVTIETTKPQGGSLYIAWSMPTEIDTIQAPGPYRYVVLRSRSDNPEQFDLIDSLNNLTDTIRYENDLNTRDFSYRYRIDFFNITPGNRFLIGSSQKASSMFLTLEPHDRKMVIKWTNDVPWNNRKFVIYRKDPGSAGFDSVGTASFPFYSDKGLTNGFSYCYKIKSIGKYSAIGFLDPIINFSQETCAVAEDNQPPCPPLLSIKTLCEESTNKLSWVKPSDTCPDDIARYYIYFSATTANLVLIDSVLNPRDSVYWHKPPNTFVGCYRILAVDSIGNRSDFGNTVCADLSSCPDFMYSLPNVFTPNGDEWNELFKPFPYRSVVEIQIEIFDRWGRMVFKTSDPEINWDGLDRTTGQRCSDGVYFYVCDVYETTLSGVNKRTLHGSVTLLR